MVLKVKKMFFNIILIVCLTIFIYTFSLNNNKKNTVSIISKSISEKWIVVTSINMPTDSIKILSKIENFQLIVVGDITTPNDWSYPNVIFLSINDQIEYYSSLANVIPTRCYCRKIFGYLYAIQHGAKYIYDTDDDNSPIVDINHHFIYDNCSHGLIANIKSYDKNSNEKNEYNVINPYAHFGQSSIWPRGYPLNRIKEKNDNMFSLSNRKTSIIQQGVVNGDPDVDAIYRLINSHEKQEKFNIEFDFLAPSIQLPSNLFSPFNSQNTLFHYDAFWSLYLPHSVTFRITDIWRGYWCQPLLWLINSTLEFHAATAYQYRNPHSYLKDFKEEDDLYKKTDELLEVLHQWKCNENKVFKDCIIDLSKLMAEKSFWSYDEAEHIEIWLDVLTSVGYNFPLRVISQNNNENNFYPILFQPKIDEFIRLKNYEFSKVYINDLQKKKQIEFLKEKCFNLTHIDYYNILKHDESKFSNLSQTTLLITFNKEVYIENIQYIFSMYADYFNRIIFCGKNVIETLKSIKDDDMRIFLSGIDLDLADGYFHYDCMTKAIQMRLNTRGILLMSDDVLLKPWNMRNLSVDNIWFSKIISFTLLNATNHADGWPWWSTTNGRKAALKTFSILKKEEKENPLIVNFFHNFADATGSDFTKNEIYIPKRASDIFYLPKRHFHSFQLIGGICRESKLFLEIAVPVVLSGLDSLNKTESLIEKYDWDKQHLSFKEKYNPLSISHHPVKLSNLKNETEKRDFCRLFVRDKSISQIFQN
jgi:hypothetical protein